MNTIPYRYRNCPIPGGGYVTGFVFHPTDDKVFYCRTDIGGAYRYDYSTESWVSLIDQVCTDRLHETYPAALALDPKDPSKLYMACGYSDWREKIPGVMAVSSDYGHTFAHYELPCVVHGNFPGRGAGMRLVVDPLDSSILYLATQRAGLLRSRDYGKHWESVSIANATLYGYDEPEDTFICVRALPEDTDHASMLVLGTIGTGNLTKNGTHYIPDTSLPPWETDHLYEVGGDLTRGHSLYVSYDAGAHWSPLSMPDSMHYEDCRITGLMGFRGHMDESYLYVTCHATGPKARLVLEAYSCDCVGLCDGKVLRYPIQEDGTLGNWEDITPDLSPLAAMDRLPCGFGGISTAPDRPGFLIVSTILERRGDILFRSYDYGAHWEPILHGLSIGHLDFHTPYMKSEHNGNASLIHWMSDLQIDPHRSKRAYFTTGTGVFATSDITADTVTFEDCCVGIEETVHLGVYSPPAGKVKVIDIVGDLGGFAFTDLDSCCEDSFNDGQGNRYITCINADYPDMNPDTVVVTARGNWTGQTIGGLILSHDQCQTFAHLDLPMGLSEETDALLSQIARPNRNAGWVAMGPDGRNLVWSIAKGIDLPITAVVYSTDEGASFSLSRFYDLDGSLLTEGTVRVFSDRKCPGVFYGFESSQRMYISKDYGATFHRLHGLSSMPDFRLSLIDTADRSSVCPLAFHSGIFYMSIGEHGLFLLTYDAATNCMQVKAIGKPGDIYYKIGLGVNRDPSNTDVPTIYAAATIQGQYGFYRSEDQGISWSRINHDHQMYGQIIAICGDGQQFGRFYLATGSRGILYGEEVHLIS